MFDLNISETSDHGKKSKERFQSNKKIYVKMKVLLDVVKRFRFYASFAQWYRGDVHVHIVFRILYMY